MIAVVLLALFFVGCQSNAVLETTTSVIRPKICSENQVAVPQKGICKCKPGFLFHRPTQDCYLAYRQGPCLVNEIYVKPKTKIGAKCKHNPCKKDGVVRYQGECYTLNTKGPCTKNEKGVQLVLGVMPILNRLRCLDPVSVVQKEILPTTISSTRV